MLDLFTASTMWSTQSTVVLRLSLLINPKLPSHLNFCMTWNHKVQFNTFIITSNHQIQVKPKSGIIFVLSACIVASNFWRLGQAYHDPFQRVYSRQEYIIYLLTHGFILNAEQMYLASTKIIHFTDLLIRMRHMDILSSVVTVVGNCINTAVGYLTSTHRIVLVDKLSMFFRQLGIFVIIISL